MHASLEQLQELELQMHTVTASESLRDTLRVERTFAFQVCAVPYHGSTTSMPQCRLLHVMVLVPVCGQLCLCPFTRRSGKRTAC